MTIHEINITHTPPHTHIFVDGEEIKGVTKFCLEQKVGQEIPTLFLELYAKSIKVDGVAAVEVLSNEKPAP